MSLTLDVTLPGRRVEHRHVRACLDALSATLRLWTQLLFAQRRPRAGKICAFTTSRLPSPSFSPLIQLFTSLPHLLATFLTLIPSILPGHNSFTLLDTSPPSHAYTPPLTHSHCPDYQPASAQPPHCRSLNALAGLGRRSQPNLLPWYAFTLSSHIFVFMNVKIHVVALSFPISILSLPLTITLVISRDWFSSCHLTQTSL